MKYESVCTNNIFATRENWAQRYNFLFCPQLSPNFLVLFSLTYKKSQDKIRVLESNQTIVHICSAQVSNFCNYSFSTFNIRLLEWIRWHHCEGSREASSTPNRNPTPREFWQSVWHSKLIGVPLPPSRIMSLPVVDQPRFPLCTEVRLARRPLH